MMVSHLKKLARAFTLLLLGVPTTLAQPIYDPWIIDTFYDVNTNDIGAWHGGEEGMPLEFGPGYLRLMPEAPDMGFHTKVAPHCGNLYPYQHMFIHISFAGTDRFSVALTQHNDECTISKWAPVTTDSVEAARYNFGGQDIYIPISHYDIDLSHVSSIQLNGFYTMEPIQIFKIEITSAVPYGYEEPMKLASGSLYTLCTRPNSFAFGIDDGNPELAQEIMNIIEDEGVVVTFFTVGSALVEPSANFTAIYQEMLWRGHQVALHSYSHPAMEGLQSIGEIDYQIAENIRVLAEQLGVSSRYFRPPYGVVGARTRQQLAAFIDDPYIINWSVDVEDWLWAGSDTPERQLRAFQRDLNRGGNLAVMHYSHYTTVDYFREMIRIVRESGKQIMRVDQCLEDPEAPPLL